MIDTLQIYLGLGSHQLGYPPGFWLDDKFAKSARTQHSIYLPVVEVVDAALSTC